MKGSETQVYCWDASIYQTMELRAGSYSKHLKITVDRENFAG